MGTDWIQFHIAERGIEVCRGEHAGEESLLPQMARAFVDDIVILSVAAVKTAEENRKGVTIFGDHDPMDMVGHQAIRQHPHARIGETIGGEPKVALTVGDGAEDGLAVIAPLGDVVRSAWED